MIGNPSYANTQGTNNSSYPRAAAPLLPYNHPLVKVDGNNKKGRGADMTRSQLEVFEYLLRNLRSIRGNENLINSTAGANGIAAIAMAASRQSEAYSVARESMPYLPENRRDELALRSQETTSLQNKNSYNGYQRLYEKYTKLIYGAKSKAREAYKNSIEKAFKKLRSVYQGKNSSNLRRVPYNPFKSSGLSGKVTDTSKYLANRKAGYEITQITAYRRSGVTYKANHETGGLEKMLAA